VDAGVGVGVGVGVGAGVTGGDEAMMAPVPIPPLQPHRANDNTDAQANA